MKTGCWLFVGAQHAAGVGGAIHYASPRLRRDGNNQTADLATDFLQLIKYVADGKKADVLELQLKLDQSEQSKISIQNEANKISDEMDHVRNELEASRMKEEANIRLIEEYRARLGLSTS